MTLNELYDYAAGSGISVSAISLQNKKAVSIKLDDGHYIGLGAKVICRPAEERVVLAEEIGHCLTDSFYNLSDLGTVGFENRVRKAEKTAKDCAVKLLISPRTLINCLAEHDNLFDIADELGVNEPFVRYAIDYYRNKNIL